MNNLLCASARLRSGDGATLLGRSLIAGTMDLGYYGEYSPSEVMSQPDLLALAGPIPGTVAINPTTGWLGFALDGKRLLVAKRPQRRSVSWTQLNNMQLLTGKTVTFKDEQWLLRSLRATNVSVVPTTVGEDLSFTHGSEWNRLMYRVAGSVVGLSGEGISYGEWAQFSNTELGIGTASDQGQRSWCQENISGTNGACRGYTSVSYFWRNSISANNSYHGWRPVLELID